MSEGEAQATQEQEQVVEAVYAFAAEQMKNGASPEQIQATLVEKGLPQDAAEAVVSNLTRAVSEAKGKAGKKNMLYGALWCVGGIVVTAATYSAASDGGGTYVVAWGAIIFGAIQFFRGLAQSSGT
jgi:hypothetical protein